MTTTPTHSFNPLAGIRCFLTKYEAREAEYAAERKGFNPLAGIRCFLTQLTVTEKAEMKLCFNPLAGIRCFLTSESAQFIRQFR